MLILDDYEFIRLPNNKLLVGSISPFEREDDREVFLARLMREGFKLRRGSGEEVFLKPIRAEIATNIVDQESLTIEIDSTLDEDSLK